MKKIWFYILSLTWGLPLTLAGGIIALILVITKHKPEKFGYMLHFKVGKRWGGFSCGLIFITDHNPSHHTMCHEHGHSIQNCYWGPLMLFVICIPSVIRYWYREYLVKIRNKNYYDLSKYDSIWFEGQATKLGTKLMDNIYGNKN